jgi:hypothetical protein
MATNYVPFQIPVVPKQAQKFKITISGTTHIFTIKWNGQIEGGCWVLDIADINENDLVTALPLVTGANLLAPFAYLGLGFLLLVQTEGDADAVPTYENFGVNSHLYALVPTAA